MLCDLETLTGCAACAIDGEIGSVRNFLFDDESWTIRYLVVEVGNWLGRRDVVLATASVYLPDWENRTLRVRLTKEEVRHSPEVDSTKPVSRQQEIAMREYFGWPAYWETLNAEFPSAAFAACREFPVGAAENPHLRSVENMIGYDVWAEEGQIGRLQKFIADETSWHIGYLDVKMGSWLHCRSLLVPTSWVKSISWVNRCVTLCMAGHLV